MYIAEYTKYIILFSCPSKVLIPVFSKKCDLCLKN